MTTVVRHPSAPRKTPPPPRHQVVIPVVVCAACKDPVVPEVAPPASPIVAFTLFLAGVVPGILYLIFAEMRKRNAVACPRCTGRELVPADSTRGREILGERYEAVLAEGTRAVLAARREAEQQATANRALALRVVLAGAVVVLVGSGVAGAVFMRGRRAAAAAPVAPAEAPVAPAATSHRRSVGAAGTLLPTGTIVTATSARSRPEPGAATVLEIAQGERFLLGEERSGWVRLFDADVAGEAWVERGVVQPPR